MADAIDLERWLPIPGHEGRYEVSDLGRVRSNATGQPRVLKLVEGPRGYMQVSFSRGGRRTNAQVHRIVAEAFIGPHAPRAQIRHLDGVKSNNRAANLVYGTQSENTLDMVRHGVHNNASKTQCPHGHAYDAVNTYLRGDGARECRTCRARWARRSRARQHDGTVN